MLFFRNLVQLLIFLKRKRINFIGNEVFVQLLPVRVSKYIIYRLLLLNYG